MTMFLMGESGFLGDVATLRGWDGVRAWAPEGSEWEFFANNGWSEEPPTLLEELEEFPPPEDESTAGVLRAVVEAIWSLESGDPVILSDGSDGHEMPSGTL